MFRGQKKKSALFFRQLRSKVRILEGNGMSLAMISQQAGLERNALAQLMNPKTEPNAIDFEKAARLVAAINRLGVKWDYDSAMYGAGFPLTIGGAQKMLDSDDNDIQREPVDHRPLIDARGDTYPFPQAQVDIGIYDALEIGELGVNASTRVATFQFRTTQIALENVPGFPPGSILIMETIGEILPDDFVIARATDRAVVLLAREAQSKEYPIIGKIVGHFSTTLPGKAKQQNAS